MIEPKHHTIIGFYTNTVSILLSVDTSEYEYQEARRQYEGGGVMEPNQDPIIYLSENTVSVAM